MAAAVLSPPAVAAIPAPAAVAEGSTLPDPHRPRAAINQLAELLELAAEVPVTARGRFESAAELAALGVPTSHVKPVGPLGRPTELSGHIPSLTPWVSVPVDWERFGDKDALLQAFGELVAEVRKTA